MSDKENSNQEGREKFSWKNALQENYLVVAVGLIAAGVTGGLGAYAYVEQYFTKKFDDLVAERQLVQRNDLAVFEPPADSIIFTTGACPGNWTDYLLAGGRYLVVSNGPNDPNVGATVGSRLASLENRPAGQHRHQSVIQDHANRQGNPQLEFQPGGGHVDSGTKPTSQGDDLTAGTNAPYIVVRACVRQ